METTAPATVAPDGSVTVPAIEPELPMDCAAHGGTTEILTNAQTRAMRKNIILSSRNFSTVAGDTCPPSLGRGGEAGRTARRGAGGKCVDHRRKRHGCDPPVHLNSGRNEC